MAQAAKSQEPSMEEILASIRRIIAEDDSEKSAPRPAETTGVELNPDAAASSLGAARAMGDSYSPAAGIAFLKHWRVFRNRQSAPFLHDPRFDRTHGIVRAPI